VPASAAARHCEEQTADTGRAPPHAHPSERR
jgi:hypothetical protein